MIRNDFFSLTEPGIFRPIVANLLEHGDFYMNLADLRSFIDMQGQVEALYRDQERWSEKAILNIARAGKFSSDRTIAEYADQIWDVKSIDVVPAAEKKRASYEIRPGGQIAGAGRVAAQERQHGSITEEDSQRKVNGRRTTVGTTGL